MSNAALVVVDDNHSDLEALRGALLKRYGSDYAVHTAKSPDEGLTELQRLVDEGADVALVAADLHLPGIDGIEFLRRAHALHQRSIRVLLVDMDQYHTRVPFTELPTLQRATALGQIDYWMVKGWTTPEEWVYPLIQEALTAWTMANRPHHAVYRIVGQQWEPRSHELRDMLTRNGVPFDFYRVDSPEGRQLIQELGIDTRRLPAFVRHDGAVLQDPTFEEVAAAHGVRTRPSRDRYDLAIIGAGPAGLAAAVYGASEGLRTLVIEREAIGGQAGSSSMIRNYMGFRRGITGGELAHRAWEQAVFFGAEFAFIQSEIRLSQRGDEHLVTCADGTKTAARAVLITTGVSYRRLGIAALDRLIGMGVFYGAAGVVAPAMTGEEVYVVGGANSAGQAALHLAKFAGRVVLLVRGPSLAAGMSEYLITQLQATTNVEVRVNTRVVDGQGDSRLEQLTLEDVNSGSREHVRAAALFVLIGAEPHTDWLRETLRLGDRGYILTGHEVASDAWPLTRPPLPFETSLPGVFAAGDVRNGSVKRVAAAAGEGSVAITQVHEYLTQIDRQGLVESGRTREGSR